MDFVISFFRDTLDGPLYFIVTTICLIAIIMIVRFIMRKSRLALEESYRTVIISDIDGKLAVSKKTVINTSDLTNGSNEEFEDDGIIKSENAATATVSNFIDFDAIDEEKEETTNNIVDETLVDVSNDMNNETDKVINQLDNNKIDDTEEL